MLLLVKFVVMISEHPVKADGELVADIKGIVVKLPVCTKSISAAVYAANLAATFERLAAVY